MGGYNAAPGDVRAPFMIMDIIGLPIVSHIMAYWGDKLCDEQMKKNAIFVKENYRFLNIFSPSKTKTSIIMDDG